MKWHKYNCGDTRIRKGFLFIPRCTTFTWRWLECAEWEEIYGYNVCGIKTWSVTEWIDIQPLA